MRGFARIRASWLVAAALWACASLPSLAQVSVRSVRVLGHKDTVEVEVEASDRVVPQTRVLTGPDRLVIDFPNAVPSNQVRNQSIDRGEVKDVRVGLFQSKPPITRVVLDLNTARSFQVFPSGRTVMIKVLGGAVASNGSEPVEYAENSGRRPGLVTANYTTGSEPATIETPPQPPLQVTYHDGLLGIRSNKATLSEVLYAVQQRTGADISIAAGAEQEKVVADIAPAPAAEVLARLLNGSRFNFLILNAADNPRQLDRVILSARGDGGGFMPAPAPQVQNNDVEADDDDPPPARPQPAVAAQPQTAPGSDAEPHPVAEENAPDQ